MKWHLYSQLQTDEAFMVLQLILQKALESQLVNSTATCNLSLVRTKTTKFVGYRILLKGSTIPFKTLAKNIVNESQYEKKHLTTTQPSNAGLFKLPNEEAENLFSGTFEQCI